MSWGKANVPTQSPKPAGIDGGDMSTNEQAVPVGWHIGLEWWPLTWIVDKVYNQRTEEIRQKAGKGKETVSGYRYYGDVAGIACLGLADKVLAFESGNEVVWTGDVARPDNPLHPDYWRANIVTPVAKMAFYWGRANQPVDELLLEGIGLADPTLAHPGYRFQCPVILQDYFFGENTETVPNSRVLVWRAPRPELGTFAPQFAAGGESILAGMLELATNPIFGAGLPLKHFQAGEWEAMSAAILAALGGLSPSLNRAVPLRDVFKDLQGYYDGWTRIENGRLKPGCFPHDGTVPGGLTEMSVHDFIDHPDVRAGTPSSTVNDVRVIYRDKDDLLKRKPATGSASANVKARRGHDPKVMAMPGFITRDQAARFAAEAAVSGAEGEWGGEGLRVRGPRAKWAGGAPLQAGDNFNLDLIAPQVDQVSRITRRVDFFRAPPTLDFIAERGVYPSPYIPPGDLRPNIGKVVPLEIAEARVLEVTPELAGTPLGLPVAFIAKRPKTEFEGATLQSANSVGFNVWYSLDGGSYDQIGNMPGWGVRGEVREAIASATADVVVKLTLDADNLDLGRLAAQSAESQLNDALLIVIGDELFSVGAISIAGLDYDLSCKRVRLGSLQAAHGLGDDAWIVWRDELRVFTHKGFIEDQDRYFKLQPYTLNALLELADVDPLVYHFRDRAPELPVIVLNALGGTLKVGRSYYTSGTISDVNGDLTNYQVTAARIVAGDIDSEFTIDSGPVPPDARAFHVFRAPFVFPLHGTWRIYVRAYDETGGFTEEHTVDLTVALNEGDYGPDDGVTPNIGTSVALTPGLGVIFGDWVNPSNTPILWTEIYVATTAVQPVNPIMTILAPQVFFSLDKLPAAALRYVWFKWKGRNGRFSAVDGPYSVTTRAGVNLSDIIPGMTLVEIVTSLPGSGNFDGRTVVLTTNGKLYRYSGGAWTAAVPAVDVTGQITNTQIADNSISTPKLQANAVTANEIAANAVTTGKLDADAVTAGKIAAGAITAAAVGANLIITNTANIDNAVITEAKIADAQISNAKIQDAAITTAKIGDLQVDTLKIGDNAVTVPITAQDAGPVSVAPNATIDLLSCNALPVLGSEPVYMTATFEIRAFDNNTHYFRFLKDGVMLVNWEQKIPVIGRNIYTITWVDYPGAGTYNWGLQVYASATNSTTDQFSKITMLALSARK